MVLPIAAFMLLPLLYIFNHAFKPFDELLEYPPKFFVSRPTFNNFVELSKLTKTEIIKFIKNSANPEVIRLYHSNNWAARLHSVINGKGYNSSISKKIDYLLEQKEISQKKELR